MWLTICIPYWERCSGRPDDGPCGHFVTPLWLEGVYKLKSFLNVTPIRFEEKQQDQNWEAKGFNGIVRKSFEGKRKTGKQTWNSTLVTCCLGNGRSSYFSLLLSPLNWISLELGSWLVNDGQSEKRSRPSFCRRGLDKKKNLLHYLLVFILVISLTRNLLGRGNGRDT